MREEARLDVKSILSDRKKKVVMIQKTVDAMREIRGDEPHTVRDSGDCVRQQSDALELTPAQVKELEVRLDGEYTERYSERYSDAKGDF